MKLKKKEKRELYGSVSKYLEELSKLVIAGVVLASVMKGVESIWLPVILGILVGAIILYGSYYAFIKSKLLE